MASKKKKKITKAVKGRIYLMYSEYRSGGEVCAGQEGDSWPDYEDAHIEVTFHYLFRNPRNGVFCDSYEIDPKLLKNDELYLAVAYYYDGNTFGRTYGYWSVQGVFATSKEAEEKLAQDISDGESAAAKHNYKDYKPWNGYFSGLMHTDVVSLRVED
jgi:hypothetical protein